MEHLRQITEKRMRIYAQQKTKIKNTPTSQVGTVARVKLGEVDKGKLDHKSIPGVVCEATEYKQLQDCLQGRSAE
jgi:hypothetical protein